jgi:hypothetical protein
MVNNSTNINKTYSLLQIIKHKKNHDMWLCKSRSWLETDTHVHLIYTDGIVIVDTKARVYLHHIEEPYKIQPEHMIRSSQYQITTNTDTTIYGKSSNLWMYCKFYYKFSPM